MQQRTLHGFFLRGLGNVDRFHRVGVQLRVVHAGGDGAGGGIEVLYLFRMHMVIPQEQRELYCLRQRAPRMGGHEIGHQILLLADALGDLIESLLECLIALDVRLSHLVQYHVADVFRCDFQLTADVL